MPRSHPSWIILGALAVSCGGPASIADTGVDAPARFDAGSSDAGSDDVRVDDVRVDDVRVDDVRVDDAGPDPEPAGTLTLDACLGLSGVSERCTLFLNASACTTTPCTRLVVVFSGGEQGCAMSGYQDLLSAYATQGWAAVCINYFDSATGSGTVPYADEAERIDLAMRSATTGAWARRYWTGEDLLIQGISHGATAPPILMARTALDDAAHWHGTARTGACFFDGTYDQAATAENLRTSGVLGGECRFPVSYMRWLERYCGSGATSCDLTTEPSALRDTITSVAPAEYAIRDFQLFECGSALDACRQDILPAPPIQALCSTLDASPDHTCAYVSLPDQDHVRCHGLSFDRCRTWFESL